MQHFCGADSFVEVIAILGYDGDVGQLLKVSNSLMTIVRLLFQNQLSDGVHKIKHTLPSLCCITPTATVPRLA